MAFIFNNISIHLRRFLPQHCGYYYKHLPNPSDHEILIPHLRLAAPVFVGSAVPFSDELYHQCYLSEIPVSLRTKALCTAKDDALLCRLYAYDQANVPYWVLPPFKLLSDTFSPQVIALAVGQLISGAAALLMTKVFFAVPI